MDLKKPNLVPAFATEKEEAKWWKSYAEAINREIAANVSMFASDGVILQLVDGSLRGIKCSPISEGRFQVMVYRATVNMDDVIKFHTITAWDWLPS